MSSKTPGQRATSRTAPPVIQILRYDDGGAEERALSPSELAAFEAPPKSAGVIWINVEGLEPSAVERIGKAFGLHPLLFEDILNVEQRPKLESYDAYFYIALKMASLKPGASRVTIEHVSLVLGEGFVLTFQEGLEGDVFEPVRDKIRNGATRIRSQGADFLAYALVNAVVDHYFDVLERLGDELEELERDIGPAPKARTIYSLHRLRRELIYLRRSVWPLREIVTGLLREENALIRASTTTYLRDVYDHSIQVIDTVETYRDLLSGMVDVYLSRVSNRLNETMKVLTIIATIFMPLSFIAGVYGMNFERLPELRWRFGYAWALGLMALTAGAMLAYFRRKNFIGKGG